jgi:heat shock protein HtpX
MEKMGRIDFRDQISRNKTKSFFLVASIFLVIILLGYIVSNFFDPGYFFIIMIISIIFSISYTLISYYNSDKIAVMSAGAKKADRNKYKDYYNLVEGLTLASGMPRPELYIMPSSQINAFASGRDPKHSVVCVTEGALAKLDRRELEGVLAHELGHIGNYDIRFMTLVAVMVGMVAIVSEMFLRSLWLKSGDSDSGKAGLILMIIGILLAIFAPIAVQLVQLSISRKHEYSADATAVKFTRYPQGLIGALKKIKQDYSYESNEKKVSKAIAPLFFASPLKNLTSTHPPIESRIAALERM